MAVSIAGCCTGVCTGGWDWVLFSSVGEAEREFLLGGCGSLLGSRVLSRMWDSWLDVDTVPTDAVIRGLYGVGSRCVLQNDRATYPGPTLLCRW